MKEIQLTDEQFKLLRELSGLGLTFEQMSRCMNISVPTLRRKYLDVIEEGRVDLSLTLRRRLYKLATEKDNLGALIFLAKTIGGMSEKQVVELNLPPTSSELTDDQREQLLRALAPPKLSDEPEHPLH